MSESTEQQLRRELEELRQQLRAKQEGHSGPPPNRWRPSGLTISVLLLGFALVLAGAFFAGYVPLQKRAATVEAEAEEQKKGLPHMQVMRVERAPSENSVRLPGTMQAVTEVPILARTDGYLKSRLVDIGDRVKAGQVLAEIDAPELEHQTHQAESAVTQAEASLEQAKANLEQGKSNLELARVTADRYKTLTAQGVVSKQDNDQFQAQLVSQSANVVALEKAVAAQQSILTGGKANVARLVDLQDYRIVRAPFDGVITVRNIDVGALVSTGTTLLYRIAQTETLRTYVNMPQMGANSVHVGQPAALTLANFPGRKFYGKVTRTANALDPNSRTMLVEVDIPNPNGVLFPGMYAEVDLSGPSSNPPLVIPAQALIARADGAQVAQVDSDGTVHLRKVAVGRDYGDRVEITQGVPEGATILTAPADIVDGAKIVPAGADSTRP